MRNREELDGWADKLMAGFPESTSNYLWVKSEIESSDLTQEEKNYVFAKSEDICKEILDKRVVLPQTQPKEENHAGVIVGVCILAFVLFLGIAEL